MRKFIIILISVFFVRCSTSQTAIGSGIIGGTLASALKPSNASQKTEGSSEMHDTWGVVISDNLSREQARKEARKIAESLAAPLADESLLNEKPPAGFVGRVVSIVHKSNGQFRVLTFLGSKSDASAALVDAKLKYPDAFKEIVQIDKKNWDASYATDIYKRVVILGSKKSYKEAHDLAIDLSKKTGITLNLRGLNPHPKLGLSFSKDACEEGEGLYPCYVGRGRYDEELYLSIELSRVYRGFEKDLYIVVAGVFSNEEAENQLNKIKLTVPDAYSKRTLIYYGCLH